VIGETFSWDDPDNYCFGCSQRNAQGLQLRFKRVAQNAIRCDYPAASTFQGAPEVLHGGIQATLLDEVMGTTAHTAFAEHVSGSLVTAEFSLRYRRPVPVEAPIVVFGELRRVDGRNYFVDARIESVAGETLAVADARWCLLNGSV
jgi:acyl-coenzyme A thioesterase PaaI-like protein